MMTISFNLDVRTLPPPSRCITAVNGVNIICINGACAAIRCEFGTRPNIFVAPSNKSCTNGSGESRSIRDMRPVMERSLHHWKRHYAGALDDFVDFAYRTRWLMNITANTLPPAICSVNDGQNSPAPPAVRTILSTAPRRTYICPTITALVDIHMSNNNCAGGKKTKYGGDEGWRQGNRLIRHQDRCEREHDRDDVHALCCPESSPGGLAWIGLGYILIRWQDSFILRTCICVGTSRERLAIQCACLAICRQLLIASPGALRI